MESQLDTCLNISGTFEGGKGARWSLVTGNFDKMGISCGALQWNAGTGSLQTLLKRTLGDYPVADDQFAPLFALKDMLPSDAVAYAVKQWGDSTGRSVTADARALWQTLLTTEQCIAAQRSLAQEILDSALAEASKFLPWMPDAKDHLRVSAFFFDVHTQQGSLSKKLKDGTRKPDPLSSPEQADPGPAIAMASQQGKTKTADAWKAAVEQDQLAAVLLHYAYLRAQLGNPAYVWDTLSRRGTIACRLGGVHGSWYDFTSTLP